VTVIDEGTGAAATRSPAPPAGPEPTPAIPAAPSSASGTPAQDATATLERLASLRDRGLITAEEYDAKKRELLERI
jgi:hypothetical protein